MNSSPGVQRSGAVIAALDLLHARESDADHFALDLADDLERRPDADGVVVATHAATVGTLRHVAVTVEADGADVDGLWRELAAHLPPDGVGGLLLGDRFAGQPELRAVVSSIADEHRGRRSGRVVAYPGHRSLVGTVTVGQILATTAIDDVRVLAGDLAADDMAVITRDFVRPRWRVGRLVLDTQPARGGTLVPFETPTPTPCCADHA